MGLLKEKIYVYPKLPAVYDLGFIRLRGSGLSNCLFIVSRAYLLARTNGWELINPTWLNFSLGPYLRNEKDKRHYFGLFRSIGISGIQKLYLLLRFRMLNYDNASNVKSPSIIVVSGLHDYFESLILEQEILKKYLLSRFRLNISSKVYYEDVSNVIGIHIRLGDFDLQMRTELDWYACIVRYIHNRFGSKYKFHVFSDGSDEELKNIISLPEVQRVFYGNAIADIYALSNCKMIIGSDSTFSGWAVFLGQIPCVFPKKHFGRVLKNTDFEYVAEGKNFIGISSFIDNILL